VRVIHEQTISTGTFLLFLRAVNNISAVCNNRSFLPFAAVATKKKTKPTSA
jgi:hypothetical protein